MLEQTCSDTHLRVTWSGHSSFPCASLSPGYSSALSPRLPAADLAQLVPSPSPISSFAQKITELSKHFFRRPTEQNKTMSKAQDQGG